MVLTNISTSPDVLRVKLWTNRETPTTATVPMVLLLSPSLTRVTRQGSKLPELHPSPKDVNSSIKDKSSDRSEIINGFHPLHPCKTA